MSKLLTKFTKNILKGLDGNVFGESESIYALRNADKDTPLILLSGDPQYSVGFCFFTGKVDLPSASLRCTAALIFKKNTYGDFAASFELSFKGVDNLIVVSGSPTQLFELLIDGLAQIGVSDSDLDSTTSAFSSSETTLKSKSLELQTLAETISKKLNSM